MPEIPKGCNGLMVLVFLNNDFGYPNYSPVGRGRGSRIDCIVHIIMYMRQAHARTRTHTYACTHTHVHTHGHTQAHTHDEQTTHKLYFIHILTTGEDNNVSLFFIASRLRAVYKHQTRASANQNVREPCSNPHLL